MAKISAVIIAKNEERNIGRCLDSLVDVADEIVVVDSFSEDRTVSICNGYPLVRIVQKEWMGFSDTKQFAMGLASNDFILSIDADEELSCELRQEIISLKDTIDSNAAFYINRLTNYCGQWIYHSGWHPDFQMRIFPAQGGSWNGAPVHESIELADHIKAENLTGLLHHYSYYSINDHLKRAQNYTDLGAQQILRKGKRFLLLRAVISPFFGFLRNYFLRLGILDGAYGFAISLIGCYVVFLKYFKAWGLSRHRSDTGAK